MSRTGTAGAFGVPRCDFSMTRGAPDLLLCEEFAVLAARIPDFRFVLALPHAEPDDGRDGERGGIIYELPARTLRAAGLDGEIRRLRSRPAA